MRIKKIGKYSEIKNPYGEILCINKFSRPMFNQLIIFLRNYFKKKIQKLHGNILLVNLPKKTNYIL